MDDVIRGFVDLALHLDWLLLVLGHFYPEDPEVRPSEIQSDEVAFFCEDRGGKNKQTNRQQKGEKGDKYRRQQCSQYRVVLNQVRIKMPQKTQNTKK